MHTTLEHDLDRRDLRDAAKAGRAAEDPAAEDGRICHGVRACAVLFVDIVAFSKLSVSEQQAVKVALGHDLRLALIGVAKEDVLVADTGDGFAITFLHDIERAYVAATRLREYLHAPAPERLHFQARMGINVGPVKVVIDLNEHRNVIGDGINVAQRVMSFAAPGQLLISGAYYEMLKRLKPEYEQSLVSIGRKFDKHARGYEVYAVCTKEPAQPQITTPPRDMQRSRVWRWKSQVMRWSPRIALALTVAIASSMLFMSRAHDVAQSNKATQERRVADVPSQGRRPAELRESVQRSGTTGRAPKATVSPVPVKPKATIEVQRFGRT